MSAKRILIVEDDQRVREAYEDILGSVGHTVVAVDDGARALQEVTHQPPDVILLDLLMPKAHIDGIGLLARLPASGASDIPIIILSALGDALAEGLSPEIVRALRIVAILAKPVSLETLTAEIDRLVGPGSSG